MNIIDAGLKFNGASYARDCDVNGIVLHHAAAETASVETIHKWHLGNGWIGIGYHFYVRKDGTIYKGREENWIGAHTVGHNSTKIGICAEGNFENEKMPDAQKNAIIDLVAYLKGKYGNLKLYGHRDLDATACPGKNYPFNDIVNGTKGSAPAVKPITKPKEENTVNIELKVLREGSENETVKALQRMLYAMGYNLGSNPIDGIFGSKTEAAVRAFQNAKKLDVDGIVGKDTWTKLLKG
jgi:N-acetyl-anhydromuramyl-L-alanine amidase AmpD